MPSNTIDLFTVIFFSKFLPLIKNLLCKYIGVLVPQIGKISYDLTFLQTSTFEAEKSSSKEFELPPEPAD